MAVAFDWAVQWYGDRDSDEVRREYREWQRQVDDDTAPAPQRDLADHARSVALPIWLTADAALQVLVEAVAGTGVPTMTPLRAAEFANDAAVASMQASMQAGF